MAKGRKHKPGTSFGEKSVEERKREEERGGYEMEGKKLEEI